MHKSLLAVSRRVRRGRGRPSVCDWSAVDWNKTNSELARLLRCSTATVRYNRIRRDELRDKRKFDWESVDWSKRNEDIAAETGYSTGTVHKYRTALNKPQQPCHSRGPMVQFEWAKVDWNKNDTDISKELGCSREAVRKKRIALGIPDSPSKGRHTSRFASRQLKFANVDWTLQDCIIAASLGCTPASVLKMRRTLNKPPSPNKYKPRVRRYKFDWASVDWTKRNNQIARELGCSPMAVMRHRPLVVS